MKKALITGITGQDGSYLSELLLEKGYEVHGIVRRVALEHPQARMWRIRHILDRINIHSASMESYASIFNIVSEIKPDECYHLAAQSFVSYSFEDEARNKMGKSIVIKSDMKKGEVIGKSAIILKSPGNGLPPSKLEDIIGRKLLCNVTKDTILSIDHLSKEKIN